MSDKHHQLSEIRFALDQLKSELEHAIQELHNEVDVDIRTERTSTVKQLKLSIKQLEQELMWTQYELATSC